MTEHILIVEDSRELAKLVSDYLAQAGFRSHCLHTGETVVAWVREHNPRLILLDLMLPGCDGLTICREIRTFSQVPIIMVTARIEELDRLTGLELGADDYVCKPFSPREVVARVKAVLRRSEELNNHGTGAKSGSLQLDPAKYEARIDSILLPLTVVEYHLLALLAAEPGRVFSRGQLIERIYPDQRTVSDRTIDSHVKKLRKKISEACDRELIHSVYSAGYKFDDR
ncbi:response regulator [Desulfopila aestuarii]|uniref:Two-component system, OmpR family, response regulator BaeR n=1 Tax=Desulfopila aestuarii DSM 18488 TaxID=1121416 RepID=A0A1M7Y8V5_9BACT|nr:response regulator [Desulfopila aestuarii]SHO49039.1 two-component system, OmpR family, response regulator BaeR [Desulfopila aestuarii DSM 18488]